MIKLSSPLFEKAWNGFGKKFKIGAGYNICMNTTSESLLLRLQPLGDAVDQSAWEQFVQLYTPLIFHWARKVGLNQADAENLVQEVLTIVFRRLPDFKYEARKSFRGWLRTVTLNKFREQRRKKSAHITTASASMLEGLASFEQAESTWDIDYARLLLQQSMRQMKSGFAPTTWAAMRLVITGGATVDEAASLTGVSPWTIYSAKARLMKRLRDELQGLL